jgi:DNA modification methylase
MSSEIKIDRIICGDNREVLEQFPDNFFDLVVTSPPYGEIRDYEGYSWSYEELAKILYRKLKEGGRIVWVVGYEVKKYGASIEPFRQVCYFVDQVGFKLNQTIIYGKRGCRFPAGENAKNYERMHEYMFVFSKGIPKTFNPLKDRHKTESTLKREKSDLNHTTRGKDGERKHKIIKLIQYQSEFINRSDLWYYKVGRFNMGEEDEIFEHPAIFQEKLAEDQILSWSNKGDIILDPFSGSGTTCKMAKLLRRNYIGIDCSQKYCNIAKERIQNASIQSFESKQIELQKFKKLGDY